MKYVMPNSGIVLIHAVICAANNQLKLSAVTNGDIATALYRRIRNEVPYVKAPSPMDLDVKNQICRHITRSSYMSGVLGKVGVYTHEIFDRLNNLDPNIEILGRFDDTSLGDIMHSNPIKLIDTYVTSESQSRLQENVFTCLTTDPSHSDSTVFIYLVSGEYNLSDTPNPYIAGRFVFFYRPDEGIIKLTAIAEEPAEPLSTKGADVESLYVEGRAGHEPEVNQSDDPICSLTRDERLRLCTVVLSSVYFEAVLVGGLRCSRKDIALQDEQTGIEAEDASNGYEEWMISCRVAPHHDTEFQYEFFLSRAYDSINEVFVYRRKEGSDSEAVVLENKFGNVRFKI